MLEVDVRRETMYSKSTIENLAHILWEQTPEAITEVLRQLPGETVGQLVKASRRVLGLEQQEPIRVKLCTTCNREIPSDEKVCPYCEIEVRKQQQQSSRG